MKILLWVTEISYDVVIIIIVVHQETSVRDEEAANHIAGYEEISLVEALNGQMPGAAEGLCVISHLFNSPITDALYPNSQPQSWVEDPRK